MRQDSDLISFLQKEGLELSFDEEGGVYRIQGVFSSETFALLDQLPCLTSLSTHVPAWPVKSMSELKSLSIRDNDLAVLSRCSQLQDLSLRDSVEVTDAGLIHLRGLTQLWSLILPCNITDEGLRHLDSLASLRNLHLYATQATGVGVNYLKNLPHLEHIENWFEVWQGEVCDKAIEAMVTLPHILRLFLTASDIRDDSLRHLENAHSLQELFLNDTSITDNSVEFLCGAPNLASLNVAGTHLTHEGIARLRTGLPNTDIYASTRQST